MALKKYTESEEFQIAKSQRIWDNWVSKVSGVFVRFLAQIAITAQDIGNYFSQMWRYMSFISVTEGKNLMTIAKNVSYNIGQAFGSI